eukprot:snap_masked-scaffold_24-processed-gene-5.44-mRNA-1 protein AED:1.00 eAED:1.00 QI:0/-1/0/0/-1/1/1/0/237
MPSETEPTNKLFLLEDRKYLPRWDYLPQRILMSLGKKNKEVILGEATIDQEDITEAQKKKIEKMNKEQMLFIVRYISSQHFPLVKYLNTSYAMITALKQQFEGDKAVDLQVTRIQLENFKLSNKIEISTQKFKELHLKYLNFGGEIKDHKLSELLIRKLPPSYNTMIANIRSNAVIQTSGKIHFNNLVNATKLTSSILSSTGNNNKKNFDQRNMSKQGKSGVNTTKAHPILPRTALN